MVTVTGCTSERWLASDFSKKGSGKSASGSSLLFAVLSCARSRPLYRRRPRRPSGKSNNATCRFRLIYSRYPLEGPSTCKARVVICSHLERIGLRSPRSRKSLSPRTPLGTPLRLPSSSGILLAVRFVFASVLCILVDAPPSLLASLVSGRLSAEESFVPSSIYLSSVSVFHPLFIKHSGQVGEEVKVNRIVASFFTRRYFDNSLERKEKFFSEIEHTSFQRNVRILWKNIFIVFPIFSLFYNRARTISFSHEIRILIEYFTMTFNNMKKETSLKRAKFLGNFSRRIRTFPGRGRIWRVQRVHFSYILVPRINQAVKSGPLFTRLSSREKAERQIYGSAKGGRALNQGKAAGVGSQAGGNASLD